MKNVYCRYVSTYAIVKNNKYTSNMMTESEVSRYRILFFRHMIADIVQMAISLYKVIGKAYELQYCPLPFKEWLWLIFAAHLVSLLYYFINTVLYVIMKKRSRPFKIKLDIALYFTYFNFHIAWLAYGNSLVWSSTNLTFCITPDN